MQIYANNLPILYLMWTPQAKILDITCSKNQPPCFLFCRNLLKGSEPINSSFYMIPHSYAPFLVSLLCSLSHEKLNPVSMQVAATRLFWLGDIHSDLSLAALDKTEEVGQVHLQVVKVALLMTSRYVCHGQFLSPDDIRQGKINSDIWLLE